MCVCPQSNSDAMIPRIIMTCFVSISTRTRVLLLWNTALLSSMKSLSSNRAASIAKTMIRREKTRPPPKSSVLLYLVRRWSSSFSPASFLYISIWASRYNHRSGCGSPHVIKEIFARKLRMAWSLVGSSAAMTMHFCTYFLTSIQPISIP